MVVYSYLNLIPFALQSSLEDVIMMMMTTMMMMMMINNDFYQIYDTSIQLPYAGCIMVH